MVKRNYLNLAPRTYIWFYTHTHGQACTHPNISPLVKLEYGLKKLFKVVYSRHCFLPIRRLK